MRKKISKIPKIVRNTQNKGVKPDSWLTEKPSGSAVSRRIFKNFPQNENFFFAPLHHILRYLEATELVGLFSAVHVPSSCRQAATV